MVDSFERLEVGMVAERRHAITDDVVRMFGVATGDMNPIHFDEEIARKSMFGSRIAHGMLSAGLISAVIGMDLPGPGSIYLNQSLRFLKPVRIGDTVTACVEIIATVPAKRRIVLKTSCRNQIGDIVLDGEATVLLPRDEQ